MAKKIRDEAERFWSQVAIGAPDECWPWLSATTEKGYGRFHERIGPGHYREVKAHRKAWTLTNGPIPQGEGYHGICGLHECDNPPCCNPGHLFLGTNRDNIEDRVRKGRSNGQKGATHTRAKLDPDKVREIRRRLAAGERQRHVALAFGVASAAIRSIRIGETWKDVA